VAIFVNTNEKKKKQSRERHLELLSVFACCSYKRICVQHLFCTWNLLESRKSMGFSKEGYVFGKIKC